MTPEYLLLKFFIKDRENYIKYCSLIKQTILDKELILLLNLIDKYYEEIPEHNYISKDEFINYFNIHYTLLKNKDVITLLIDNIYSVDVSDSLILNVIKNIIEKDTANKIINKLLPILTENKFGLLSDVDEDLKNYLTLIQKQDRISPFEETPFDDLLEKHVTGDGLQWRLNCLQEDIGVLRGGYFGHIFARPDTGKTSFLCSEVTYMAQQLQDDENILWFCNEEQAGRVKLRSYSALLNEPMDKIILNKEKALELYAGRGGNRIKFIPNATNLSEIRNICFEYNPKLILIDSGDKVSFPGDTRMDGPIRLKELYWRYRLLCNEFDAPLIAVAQAGAEGAGKKWLEMHHMDYSKTGKAAEFDFAIGVGRTLDGEEDGLRYINIPKNKLNGGQGKHTIKFNLKTGRYSDL